ncbi:hypothetical protein [Aeromonas sp. Y311-2]|jgi:hypothetical protein|uniref:hypothetical protein n=1 Tax=Aeromonas sp. Y311-2 TaxID=2990507 RepID=UPI0022DF8DC2|nr:hypothetical protein [Aeromonas sp. Y311-2]
MNHDEQISFELDGKIITANIGWEADADWELCGSISISDPAQAKLSRRYRPEYVELYHLESTWPDDIYRQLQMEGFLGWEHEMPPCNRGGWGSFYSNGRALHGALQADPNRAPEAANDIGKRMGLCQSHIEGFTKILVFINELKGKRPSHSARDHVSGW